MMRLPPRHGRVVALAAILLVLNSCYAWTRHPPQMVAAVMAAGPDRVRVTRTDDPKKVVFRDPQLVGDSLLAQAGPWRSRSTVSIGIADVATVETRSLDPVRSIGAGFGVTVAILGVVTLVVVTSIDCFTIDEPCHP